MSRRVVRALVVLLAATGGALFVGGFALGGSPGAQAGGSAPNASSTTTVDATTERAVTTSERTDGAPAQTTAIRTATGPEYDFTIERVEECGTTCRDVTARLVNAGAETRRNVRVTTKVYADGDLLWTGNETVGALAPDEVHTSTKRVDVSLAEGMKIQNNGGYVTIVTVVRSDGGTTRFSERRKVS